MLTLHLKPLFSTLLFRPFAIPKVELPSLIHCNSINLRTMASGRIFQLKTDPLTGNSEWFVIEEENEAPEASKTPLLANTSYLDMLNDSCRNKAFREVIDKTITKPCHVLDIGAGTGLLSMMAARAMGLGDSSTGSSSKGMVTACESYLPMVKLMRKVLRANGMDKKIRVINKRSDELEVGVDITSRADILVSEILDSELLGEGLIPTLQHAHDKLLVENPQTIPYRATIYGQLVDSSYLMKLQGLFHNEAEASDGVCLVPDGMDGVLCIKQQQFAMHCDAIKEEIKLLSEPFKVFDFDFWKRPDSYGETEIHIKATDNGRFHAIISWWLLQLDKEGTLFYCTGPKWVSSSMTESTPYFPGIGDWCDHWKQCVWFLPDKAFSVCKDQDVHLHAVHNETSISYRVCTSPLENMVRHCELPSQENHIFISPERSAIYGDRNWRFLMLKTIEDAGYGGLTINFYLYGRYAFWNISAGLISYPFSPHEPIYLDMSSFVTLKDDINPEENILKQKASPMCVILDDSVFLAVAVANLSKTSHVISLFPGLRENGAKYLQAVASANGYSMDRVKVTKKRNCQLTLLDTQQRKVDLLIGEPFYYGSDSVLPWQNLRFWRQRTLLDPILSNDVMILPCRGTLKACAMSLPDLWRSRRCLEDIEGFDHSVVNSTLGACSDLPSDQRGPCLTYSIWQCGENKKLSNVVSIMEYNFLSLMSPCSGTAQVEFTESGVCHGFAFWIDWTLDADGTMELSTGPDQRYWKQGVKLLEKAVTVGNGGLSPDGCRSAEVKASFDPSSSSGGNLDISYVFF